MPDPGMSEREGKITSSEMTVDNFSRFFLMAKQRIPF
jgi:hypothetical protein